VAATWPGCVIQWEDFKHYNALRILDRYRDRVPSFNDDVQGTAAVVVAGLLAALRHLGQRLADQRILLVGAGAAGIGIGRLLRTAMIDDGLADPSGTGALILVDSLGVVHDGRSDLDVTKASLATPLATASSLGLPVGDGAELASIVEGLHPTVLVGTTGVAGTFSEHAVRAMASGLDRPIVLPLSNPTALAEATPEDILRWTGGRALVATGSPFAPVLHDGRLHEIGQANNVFVFPGIGLGAIASGAIRITDAMVLAAARTLAGRVTQERLAAGALYPPISDLRSVSHEVAVAVATEAIRSGDAPWFDDAALRAEIDAAMWWPDYVPYRPA
jgi:malic enzyme